MTFSAIGFNEFGGPEVLRLVEIPACEPGPGEVRVTVHAAAVNPTDTLMRSGALAFEPPQWPMVPGMDFAGVISALGPGVEWAIGDEVCGVVFPRTDPTRAAYASEVIAPAGSVVPIPKGSSMAEAASLLMNGLTALQALDLLALAPGESLGVTGGAGAVGGFALGLARARGLRVIADASGADEALVRALGADEVIARGDGLVDRFRAVAPGGLDGVIDAALIGPSVAEAVKPGGGFASVRPSTWEPGRGVRRLDVTVPTYFGQTAKLNELRTLVESGDLPLRVAATYSPDQAAQAHRDLAAGGRRGRLVLTWY